MEERLHKLNKYYEAGTSKNQQRSEPAINGRTGALNMKMTTRMKIVNQNVEDRPLKKRVRESVSEFQAEGQSNGLKKQHVAMAKHVNILKDNGEESDQFEKTRRLDAIEEGWVKKVKRKRSVGAILTRTIDSNRIPKRAIQNSVVDESGSQKDDAYSPLTKKKAIRTSHENREKSMVKERFVSQERDDNWEPSFGQWVGQRPPKVARTRRLNQDDYSPSNGKNDSPVSRNVASGSLKLTVRVHTFQSGSEESVGGERRLKGKMVSSEVDGIRVQKIGPCVTLGKKNKEGVNANDTKKNSSKPGRRLKRLSEYKGLSDNTPLENNSSPDFTGGSDDDQEELPASAKHAQTASPHQERKTELPRQHFESLFKKHDMDNQTFNGPTPFYQRVLSALIIEDDDNDIHELQEDYAKNIQIQNSISFPTSETSHHNDSKSSKRARVENSQNTKFAHCGQSEMLTGTSKSFHGCQYEQMCIDDKLLLELQCIGLCPDTLPGLEDNEDEMIHHEVDKMNTTLHQQEVKKKACLEKRSLGRCHKLEKSVTICFNETPLKDLFSAPINNELEEPKVLSDEAFTKNKPISNRGKNKKLLLKPTTAQTTISGETKGKRSNRAATKPPRAPKPQPRQNKNQPPPTTPPHPTRGKSINDQTNPPPSPLDDVDPIDDELGGVVGGGPHDLDSLFSEEIPDVDLDVDMDFGAGLDIPPDDLTELSMF